MLVFTSPCATLPLCVLQLLPSLSLPSVGLANPSCVMCPLCAGYDSWSWETGTRGLAFKLLISSVIFHCTELIHVPTSSLSVCLSVSASGCLCLFLSLSVSVSVSLSVSLSVSFSLHPLSFYQLDHPLCFTRNYTYHRDLCCCVWSDFQ